MLVFAYVIAVREEDEGSRERHVNDRAGTKGREHVVVPQAVPHAFDEPVWDRLDACFMQVLQVGGQVAQHSSGLLYGEVLQTAR